MSTTEIACLVVAYVLVTLSVVWLVLPGVYREMGRVYELDPPEQRWLSLVGALVVGALWPLVAIVVMVDRLLRLRLGR